MICKKCNFRNEDSARFCKNCGAELVQQVNLPKKKKSWLWILLTILLVVAGGLLVFFTGSSNNTQNPDEMGKQIFSTITKINNIPYSDFQKSFINADDCRILANQVSSNRTKENLLNDANTLDYVENTFQKYNYDLSENGINWTNAEYVDWLYKYKVEDGIEGIMGVLLLKVDVENEGSYYVKIRIVAYKIDEKYKWVYWDRKVFAPGNAKIEVDKKYNSVTVIIDDYGTHRFELEEMFDSKGFLPYRR